MNVVVRDLRGWNGLVRGKISFSVETFLFFTRRSEAANLFRRSMPYAVISA